jgi:hypothetical protein
VWLCAPLTGTQAGRWWCAAGVVGLICRLRRVIQAAGGKSIQGLTISPCSCCKPCEIASRAQDGRSSRMTLRDHTKPFQQHRCGFSRRIDKSTDVRDRNMPLKRGDPADTSGTRQHMSGTFTSVFQTLYSYSRLVSGFFVHASTVCTAIRCRPPPRSSLLAPRLLEGRAARRFHPSTRTSARISYCSTGGEHCGRAYHVYAMRWSTVFNTPQTSNEWLKPLHATAVLTIGITAIF